jgi:hypothetical protein
VLGSLGSVEYANRGAARSEAEKSPHVLIAVDRKMHVHATGLNVAEDVIAREFLRRARPASALPRNMSYRSRTKFEDSRAEDKAACMRRGDLVSRVPCGEKRIIVRGARRIHA